MSSTYFFWLALAVAVGGLIYLIGGALTPFALAMIFAYIGAPLAGFLERKKIPPSAAAAIVVLIFLGGMILLPLALAPLVAAQIADLANFLPDAAARLREFTADKIPPLRDSLGDLDIGELIRRAPAGAEAASGAAGILWGFFGRGISAIFGIFAALTLAPLVAFYLLRDRRRLLAAAESLAPRRRADSIAELIRDCDRALGEFLRGQLSVMAIMAVIYGALLTAVGLEFALTIGLISGLLAFIPYAGFALGFILATAVALGQFDSWTPILWVWAAMIAATTLESMWLTPKIVGERVGLHPAFVLLALMTMGGVFGFLGVLLALPLASVILAASRFARKRYLASALYRE